MNVFSNSLELERRLRLLGAESDRLAPAFERLEHFQLRFRDERYLLMSEGQIDKADLAYTLAHVTRTSRGEVVCLSCEKCQRDSREEQYRLYDLVRAGSVRRLLETTEYLRFAKGCEKDVKPGRPMIDVIKGAIGTRRLTLALDNTFGNSFASVFKHDIVAVWTMYFKSFVSAKHGGGDAERIESTGKLVDYLTKAIPAFYLPDQPHSWTVFTH